MTDPIASPSSAPLPPAPSPRARRAPAAAGRRERSCRRTTSGSSSSGRHILDWIHAHLAAENPIGAATHLHYALTSATTGLRFDDHGLEVARLVDEVLTALPERDILRKTELVGAMGVWKRRRPVPTPEDSPTTNIAPRPLRVAALPKPEPVTRVLGRNHEECDLDAQTRVFRSPFLKAS